MAFDEVVAGLSLAAGFELGSALKEGDHIKRMGHEGRARVYAEAADALMRITGPEWQKMKDDAK